MTTLKSRIEAVLFITARAVSLDEIAVILGEEKEAIEEAILELIMDYSARDGALEIDDENGYILQVKEEHMDLVELLCPVDLKPGVLRTLSVIALKEPIRLTDLKELRGSNTYEHVQELVEKGLVSKTRDKNGRSFNIKTTPKFAEYFKLKGDTRSLVKILELDKGIKDNVEAVLEEDCGTLLKKGDDKNVEQTLNLEDTISAPIKKGQKLGEISFTLNGELLSSVNIIANEDVEKNNLFTIMKKTYYSWINLLRT